MRLLLINFCNRLFFQSAMLRTLTRNEIPVAHRTYNPRRKNSTSKKIALTTFISILVLSIISTLGSEFLVHDPNRISYKLLPAYGTKDRLFGHFRYKEARQDQLMSVAPGIELRSPAAIMFKAMKRDAQREGINIQILSGFRSTNSQDSIFFDIKAKRNQTASERAKVSAPPGYSEHATGFAMDLGDGNDPTSNLSKSFEDTSAFQWLLINANRYSFTLSFPPGNPQRISYEPWHWHFEGSVEALEIFAPARS
uniref:Putative carboxypeptidase n=1 Tax=Paulinella longichromatophora TaxID=1708747 RepID=A0A2H4ZNI8_9EUKA|nr:putative carboxypeptidase [Paulinella longichromatophora]